MKKQRAPQDDGSWIATSTTSKRMEPPAPLLACSGSTESSRKSQSALQQVVVRVDPDDLTSSYSRNNEEIEEDEEYEEYEELVHLEMPEFSSSVFFSSGGKVCSVESVDDYPKLLESPIGVDPYRTRKAEKPSIRVELQSGESLPFYAYGVERPVMGTSVFFSFVNKVNVATEKNESKADVAYVCHLENSHVLQIYDPEGVKCQGVSKDWLTN